MIAPLPSEISLSVRSDGGEETGLRLVVALLPGAARRDWGDLCPLVQGPPAKVIEGAEYRFAFHGATRGVLETSHPEILQPDAADGRSGRLRTGQLVGPMEIEVRVAGQAAGTVSLLITSRKLDEERHYRWMLRDVSAIAAELLMHRFAASTATFAAAAPGDGPTLYQRIAVLQSLLETEALEAAVEEVLRRPHLEWQEEEERAEVSRGLPPGSHVQRQLARPGPRRLAHAAPAGTVPRRIDRRSGRPQVDNLPNRYVKHTLRRWHGMVIALRRALLGAQPSAPMRRGLEQVEALASRLEGWLRGGPMPQVGSLDREAHEDPVLHRAPGYREVLRAAELVETAASLQWEASDTLFEAGRRDAASLYEYWTYLQLVRIVSRRCGGSLDVTALLTADADRIHLRLARGQQAAVEGPLPDRPPWTIRLSFNQEFRSERGECWTRPMRPDATLALQGPSPRPPVLLHFDAKYRLGGAALGLAGEPLEPGEMARDDLVKMHAYRDAIHHTLGAFVLSPEVASRRFQPSPTALPALGSFALLPAEPGPEHAAGAVDLATFLDHVVDFVCHPSSAAL